MSGLPIPFGNPSTYDGHSGVDFGQATGRAIPASGRGHVTYRGWLNDRAGWSTMVRYATCLVLYCHQPSLPALRVGTLVDEGFTVGVVGNTGRSTGPHLHMEIMEGRGAHSYAGVWNYFDRTRVVGSGAPAGTPGTPLPAPTPIITTEVYDDMATLIYSDRGQSLVIGDHIFWVSEADAPHISGAQAVRVGSELHTRINAEFARSAVALPLIVYVREGEGNGTVYLWEEDGLEPLVDPSTLQALHAQGARSITLSAAEVDNLLGS